MASKIFWLWFSATRNVQCICKSLIFVAVSVCMEKSEAVVYPAMLLSYFDPRMLSCAQSSQHKRLGIGCEVSEDDCPEDMGRGRDTQGDSDLVCPSDSGHRWTAKSTNSGIRLFETGILTQFTDWLFLLNLLLEIACGLRMSEDYGIKLNGWIYIAIFVYGWHFSTMPGAW